MAEKVKKENEERQARIQAERQRDDELREQKTVSTGFLSYIINARFAINIDSTLELERIHPSSKAESL